MGEEDAGFEHDAADVQDATKDVKGLLGYESHEREEGAEPVQG